MMIDADKDISVTMKAARWQAVLGVMGEAPMPHRVVDPLIREIVQQCMQSEEAPPLADTALDAG